jgi:LysM repeat protein
MGKIIAYKHGVASLKGVDPRLWDIVQHAVAAQPYDAVIRSGSEGRPGGGKANHRGGYAIDVTLVDPKSQERIPDEGLANGGASFSTYERYAQAARVYQKEKYPELSNRFRWGGGFVQGGTPMDLMHLDITPKAGGSMAMYNWDRGLGYSSSGAKTDYAALHFPKAASNGGLGDGRRYAQIKGYLENPNLIPPGFLPDVGTELDVRPMPTPAERLVELQANVEAQRRDAFARTVALAGRAEFGVNDVGGGDSLAHDAGLWNGEDVAPGLRISDLYVPDNLRVPSDGGMDDIGSFTYGMPDIAPGGMGSTHIVTVADMARMDAAATGRAAIAAGAATAGATATGTAALAPLSDRTYPTPGAVRPVTGPPQATKTDRVLPAGPVESTKTSRLRTDLSNSRDKLDTLVSSVYGGIPIIHPEDEHPAPSWVPQGLRSVYRAPTEQETRAEQTLQRQAQAPVIDAVPDATTKRWIIPATVQQKSPAELQSEDRAAGVWVPATFWTRPLGTPSSMTETFAGTKYEQLGKEFDEHFGVPEKFERKPIIPAPSMQETRSEQMQERAAPKTSAATISPVQPMPRPVERAPIIAPVPAPRPVYITPPPVRTVTTITEQITNPAYTDWLKTQPAAAAPTVQETRNEQMLARELGHVSATGGALGGQSAVGGAAGAVSAMSPSPMAPPRTIAVQRQVVTTTQGPQVRVMQRPAATYGGGGGGGGTYTTRPGDTLSAIAARNGTTVAAIARANGISNPDRIPVGLQLQLGGSIGHTSTPQAQSAAIAAQRGGGGGGSTTSGGGGSGGGTFQGSSTKQTYEVGHVYVNSQGVEKVAMPDGSFQRI